MNTTDTDESGAEIEIDGIPIADLGFEKTVRAIVRLADDGLGGYICTPNVDHVVRARRDPQFRKAILGARVRVPDGMGIIYGSRLRGKALRQTVTGRLLPQAVAVEAARLGIGVGLIGGEPGAAAEAARRLASSSGARVSLAVCPPHGFALGGTEDGELLEVIASSDARVIFVGLGSPKQELWMARHSADLAPRVFVGVGQAIDVVAGFRRGAPEWATRLGLEWAFRIVEEPGRLARRYLLDDPPFFWWMIRDRWLSTRPRG